MMAKHLSIWNLAVVACFEALFRHYVAENQFDD
jgi:hypothetical protein